MKKFIASCLLCLSTSALAGGKLTLKPIWDTKESEANYLVGLSVYQKVLDKVAFNGWAGTELYRHPEDNWYKLDGRVETYFDVLTVGLGAAHTMTPDAYFEQDRHETQIYAVMSINLW